MYRCPNASLPAWVWSLARWYIQWKNGHLPEPGGILDQSASWVHAIELFHARVSELEAEMVEETNKPWGSPTT